MRCQAISSLCERHRVYLHKPTQSSLLHTQNIRVYSLLLLGYKPVQNFTVLNTAGNCNTMVLYYTGRSIMFSVITNIYNNKTKGHTLMELFTATGKLKTFFFDNQRFSMCAPRVTRHISIRQSSCCHTRFNVLTRVWQEFEYFINLCRVTRGAHIEHLQLQKKTFSFFLWL